MGPRIGVRNIEDRAAADSCGECAPTRRAFIGQVTLAALAFPLTFASGTQLPGGERSFPIPAADGATIDREAEVIVARFHQQAFAFNLACPHQNTALRWRAEDVRFQCPRHGSKYQPDGTFISGRATRNMDRFAVRRSGDAILVDLNRLYRSDQQNAEWTAASVAL